MSQSINKIIYDYAFIPNLEGINKEEQLFKVFEVLKKSNLPIALLPFKNGNLILKLKEKYPEFKIGLISLSNIDDIKVAVGAKPDFIISYGINSDAIEYCVNQGVAIYSEVANNQDILMSYNYGSNTVFIGSYYLLDPKILLQFKEIFPDVKFVLCDKVQAKRYHDFFGVDNVSAVFLDNDKITDYVYQDDYEGLEAFVKATLEKFYDFTVGHVGINAQSAENASKINDRFMQMFDISSKETPIAYFSGNLTEIMKIPFVGECGHICVDTNYLPRALAMMSRKGVELDEDKKFYDAKGKLITVYLKEVVGGFALHLRQKPKA